MVPISKLEKYCITRLKVFFRQSSSGENGLSIQLLYHGYCFHKTHSIVLRGIFLCTIYWYIQRQIHWWRHNQAARTISRSEVNSHAYVRAFIHCSRIPLFLEFHVGKVEFQNLLKTGVPHYWQGIPQVQGQWNS